MSTAAVPDAFRRHVWPLILRRRWQWIAAVALVGCSGAAVAVQNVFPKWLFSWVLEPDHIETATRFTRLGWLALAYLTLTLGVRMLLWHFGYRLFTSARERMVFSLRSKFFRHVNHLCLRFHGTRPSGELFSYLFGSPLAAVMQFFQHVTMSLPSSVMSVIVTFFLFVSWDWVLALLLMITAAVSVRMMMQSLQRIRGIQKEFQEIEGDVSGDVADLLRGSKAVKLYAMEKIVSQRFEEQAEVIRRKSYERDISAHVEWIKQEGLTYVCYAFLMAACTWRYLDGSIGLGVVAACLTAYLGLMGPLQAIFNAFTFWGGASAALARIGAVLDTSSTTPEPRGEAAVPPSRAPIVFEDVCFGYEADRMVLRDFSLVIRPGERVAFVGPSGAGKTTITQLLLRLYDPQTGEIRIGDVGLRRIEVARLRRYFGVVPQDPFLFNTTLRDNLRVARREATDDEIRRACEQANAWEFIAKLPGGLDAEVGEGGATLSGGQRQRLAIARALLADPECFVFDEATSALDTLSEELISRTLESGLGERTALFIAHRLATVKHCDRIVVMADGRIEQCGSYSELVAVPGLFQELVKGQQLRV